MRFADPIFFLLLAFVPFLVWYTGWLRRRRRGALRFSDLGRFKKIRTSKSIRLRHSVLGLRILALSLLVVAAGRLRRLFIA